MKIELISKENHAELKRIYKQHPNLTLQNKGYEEIDLKSLPEKDKLAHKIVETILKEHITGFIRFQNFGLTKKSREIRLRFQYNYGAEDNSMYFQGVGYILLNELLNGFKEKEND
jgi:hypothetical protein